MDLRPTSKEEAQNAQAARQVGALEAEQFQPQLGIGVEARSTRKPGAAEAAQVGLSAERARGVEQNLGTARTHGQREPVRGRQQGVERQETTVT